MLSGIKNISRSNILAKTKKFAGLATFSVCLFISGLGSIFRAQNKWSKILWHSPFELFSMSSKTLKPNNSICSCTYSGSQPLISDLFQIQQSPPLFFFFLKSPCRFRSRSHYWPQKSRQIKPKIIWIIWEIKCSCNNCISWCIAWYWGFRELAEDVTWPELRFEFVFLLGFFSWSIQRLFAAEYWKKGSVYHGD